MIRKFLSVLITVAVLLSVFILAAPVQAATGIVVRQNTVSIDYPSDVTFVLAAESDTVIDDIRLHYIVDRISYAEITSEIYMDISPGFEVVTEWNWDMRKTGGLPPGTAIEYWWTLETTDGETLTTATETLVFNDNRFEWDSVSEDNITIFWYEGDENFAGQLLEAAVEGLQRLYTNTGADFTDPVSIYIYGTTSDLQNAMIYPQTWTGGVAYPGYGTIAIGIRPSQLEWGMRTVVHELTHLVTHRITENPYLDMPTWLDEGLSMVMEGPLGDAFIYHLDQAKQNGALQSVRSLVSPFSAYADQSYLSYAESYALVDFLIEQYGRQKMLSLLTALSKGTGYDEALMKVYGFDMDGFNTIWMNHIETIDILHELADSGSGSRILVTAGSDGSF